MPSSEPTKHLCARHAPRTGGHGWTSVGVAALGRYGQEEIERVEEVDQIDRDPLSTRVQPCCYAEATATNRHTSLTSQYLGSDTIVRKLPLTSAAFTKGLQRYSGLPLGPLGVTALASPNAFDPVVGDRRGLPGALAADLMPTRFRKDIVAGSEPGDGIERSWINDDAVPYAIPYAVGGLLASLAFEQLPGDESVHWTRARPPAICWPSRPSSARGPSSAVTAGRASFGWVPLSSSTRRRP